MGGFTKPNAIAGPRPPQLVPIFLKRTSFQCRLSTIYLNLLPEYDKMIPKNAPRSLSSHSKKRFLKIPLRAT